MPSPFLRRSAAALAIAALPVAAAANVAFQNIVEVCADPDRSAAEALKFCHIALEHRSMEKQPDSVRALVLLNAGIAATELGRLRSAIDSHSRALELDPGLAQAYLGRARAYGRLGRLNEALADYDAGLRLAPGDADGWLGRGVVRLRGGDPAGAVGDFDRAVQLRSDWTAPYFNRGVAHAMTGDPARAAADFSIVIERNPDDAQALIRRGEARAALGRPGAQQDFDRALALRPDWGAGWFARGRFHDRAGRREAADADYMRAYQLGHSDPRLIERIQAIGGG